MIWGKRRFTGAKVLGPGGWKEGREVGEVRLRRMNGKRDYAVERRRF